MTATALWFTAPHTVELRPAEAPSPGPGQIQVRSVCSLVSAGSEMNIYRGEGNLPDLRGFATAEGQLPFPVKFAYQEVAVVEQAGPGSEYSPGDLVHCAHPHQTRFTIGTEWVWKVPPGVRAEQAAFAGLFGTALNSCLTTPPLVGDVVVVSGLGVVGTLTAHLASQTAGKLILVEPQEARRNRSGWLGADAVVTPEEAAGAVDELSGGRGADLCIEASGAPAALQLALRLTGVEGTVSVSSWYGSRQVPLELSPEFHLRRHKVISTGPSVPAHLAPRWNKSRMRQVAFDRLADLDVERHLVTQRIPFDRAHEAYEVLADPSTDTLAVLLDYPDS